VTDIVPAPRRHRGAFLVGLSLAVVGVLVAGAVLLLGPGGGEDEASATGATGFQDGPQGLVPQFVVTCAYSHSATDDPIVWPGSPGRSHRHDFFGNRSTTAASTPDSMLGQPTSCERQLDTAAYWAPSLFDHGEAITPLGLDAYYRPGPGIDPASVVPYPHGLVMISGDHLATEPQATAFVGWACGSQGSPEVLPPTCPAQAPLRLKVVFPDCWDGEHLDSEDHRSHVAASVGGRCPDSHPVAIPQLTLSIGYPISGDGHDLSLASGTILTGHADFMNAWDEVELDRQVQACLNRGLVCGVVSNKRDDMARPMPGPPTTLPVS
jgi:hypothetical protein